MLFSDFDLLLMDEFIFGVDVCTRHEVLYLFGDLNRDGLVVVVIIYDLNGIVVYLLYFVCLYTRIMGQGILY